MSSTEIAALTNKRKDHIIRDVWSLLSALYGVEKDAPNVGDVKNQRVTLANGISAEIDNRGYISDFWLDRR